MGDIWHNVVSVSGIKVRYSPSCHEVRLVSAKRVFTRLTEYADFYVYQALSSSGRPNYQNPDEGKPPLNPPQPMIPPRPEWRLFLRESLRSAKIERLIDIEDLYYYFWEKLP